MVISRGQSFVLNWLMAKIGRRGVQRVYPRPEVQRDDLLSNSAYAMCTIDANELINKNLSERSKIPEIEGGRVWEVEAARHREIRRMDMKFHSLKYNQYIFFTEMPIA